MFSKFHLSQVFYVMGDSFLISGIELTFLYRLTSLD